MSIYLHTPLFLSHQLKKERGINVYYKMECHQPAGSFKIRGMENFCRHYLAKGKNKFIASSGGNAGYSVAYVAQKLGAEIKVVVPESTSQFMINKITNLGVEVEVHGQIWDIAHEYALKQADEQGAIYVPPFDDPLLWQGHSSMIDECAKEMPQPSKIVLSVGGGGLLCGVLAGMKRNHWGNTEVITAETYGAASFQQSQEKKELITLDSINTIASSLGARKVSKDAFEMSKNYSVSPYLMEDKDTIMAMISFLNEYHSLVEPACGAALSYPLLQADLLKEGENILVIVCGGVNTSLDKLNEYKEHFGL